MAFMQTRIIVVIAVATVMLSACPSVSTTDDDASDSTPAPEVTLSIAEDADTMYSSETGGYVWKVQSGSLEIGIDLERNGHTIDSLEIVREGDLVGDLTAAELESYPDGSLPDFSTSFGWAWGFFDYEVFAVYGEDFVSDAITVVAYNSGTGGYSSPIDNSDGSYTFNLRPDEAFYEYELFGDETADYSTIGDIYLAGEFNEWLNAEAGVPASSSLTTNYQLTDSDGDGVYTLSTDMPTTGDFYKFVVYIDGRTTPVWLPDVVNHRMVLENNFYVNSFLP